MDNENMFDEQDTFEQNMHDALVLIGFTYSEYAILEQIDLTTCLKRIGIILQDFATYATQHDKEESKYRN